MPLKQNQNGISLIEILLAVVIAVVVVVTLSISLPMALRNILANRQRWVAINLANAQIQTLKSQPYLFVNTTDVSVGPNPFISPPNPTCDCRTLDFSALPSTSTQVTTVSYTLASCIHFVNPGTWTSQCASAGDTGYKNIVVRVAWTTGSQTLSVTQESMLTRN